MGLGAFDPAAGDGLRGRFAGPRARAAGLWAVLTGIALYFAWLKQPAQVDDAFIYLRYARNLVEGKGWVYNDGEWVNGATSAGNTLLLALAGLLTGGRFVLAQILVFGLGLGSAAFFVQALLRPQGIFAAAAGAAALLATPFLYWLVGMDTAPILGFAAAAVWADSRGRLVSAAVLLSALCLTRPDGVFLVAVLLGRRLAGNRRRLRAELRRLALPAAVFAAPLAAWMVFSYVEFGTLLPKTLGAKLAQTASGIHGQGQIFFPNAVANLQMFFSIRLPALPSIAAAGWAVCFVAPGLAGALVAARGRSPVLPLVLAGFLQAAASGLLNLPNYLWYYVPLNVALALSIAVLAGTLFGWRPALRAGGFAAKAAALAVLVAFLYPTLPDPRRITSKTNPGFAHYKSETFYPHYYELARWLRDHAPAGGSLACAEIGVLGFELPSFRIVDMWGLVTRGGAAAIARGDFAWWFRDARPDWILLHDPVWEGPEKAVSTLPAFQRGYELVRQEPDRLLFHRRG